MRHWYLLAGSPSVRWQGVLKSDLPTHSKADQRKMLLLGGIEILPLGTALTLDSWTQLGLSTSAWAGIGFVLSITMCWMLRHRTPLTVIQVADVEGKD